MNYQLYDSRPLYNQIGKRILVKFDGRDEVGTIVAVKPHAIGEWIEVKLDSGKTFGFHIQTIKIGDDVIK